MNIIAKLFKYLCSVSIILIYILAIIGIFGILFSSNSVMNLVLILSPAAFLGTFIFYCLEQLTINIDDRLARSKV